ncbi:hypothetical protein K435DRAFT_793015 [Dendrothele bispora CBS 962.96]|uniref:Uncharacterized protein n=1 Tax=Dendrothele bispora (strain CBS 962.96) TaxID=1314807 RepID=A0A4S8MHF8_DENBC|nr:hypothetical protein K435DRAFT_793015 [Dendrothele bispora CBS 962.96]
MSLTDDQVRTALSLTALVKPFEDNRANGRATAPADFENLLRQATPLVDRLRFEANQRVPNWVLGAIFVLHLVIMNIKSEYARAKINASDTPDWFLSKDNLRSLSKHHAWFNRDLPPEPPRDPLDLLDDFFDTPAPKSTKPAAKAGAIPGITPRKPSAFTIPDAPSAATSRKASTKSTPQVMMPPPITVKKPLPPAKQSTKRSRESTKRSREVQALEREAQEASMSERLEESPDETPVTKKAKQQAPKPSNTRQLRPKNRPVSPLKPASTSKSRQKQKATSLDSFIDDATQEESEDEEEDEGERTADTQIEEGEATEPEAEATDAEAERPPSPVQQKEKTVKRTRHRTRTSKTRQTPALDRPDTNEEDPDVQDGTNEEALTAPVGVPTRIIRSKLPRHAMLRDPNFSAHAGSGYIFVNRTGSMLNVEDLLETNHSFSGTVDRSMSLDRLEIFSQGVHHIIQQSSPAINHQIQRVLALNEITAAASNHFLRLNRFREEEIAQLQRQLTDVPRLLWQIELSNPDFELDDDKLRELSLACGWSFVPSEGDARQIFESLQELDDDQNTSFNQPFSAASLWLERLAASRSGRVPSPEYTFTLTTDLDLDQQPVASSSRVRLPTPTPRSPAGPATVEDLLSEHEASFLQTSTIVETQTATDESHEDLPADTPAPKSKKPAAKAGAIPGITPQKPSPFNTPDAPSAPTTSSRKISTKPTPQVMMPPPITVKKPLPVAKPSAKRSREVQALEREAQEAAMSEHLEDSPDETPVTKKAKQQVPKPSNTRQLRPKNRPVSPLKPASTSKSRQKQKAGSMSSFIDDASQEESEEEEEEEGERTADTQVEEGEATEGEAEATDAEAERPPSPVQQKEKTGKRTRHRTRTSKTRQPLPLDRPDTNEEDPDVQDGTNEEALTAPVGVPTRIIRSKLPRHAMLRDPNFSAHAGSGYIFVNRTGSMLNVEDLLETNHSFSGTVDRSVCSTCATDTHYRSCVYQGPGKQCNRCHTAGRHCSFEMSLDRLEIFAQGVHHIVQQSSPAINHQIQRVLALNEITAAASNHFLRLNRFREEEIAQLQRQLTDVPRLLWQIELSNPDFELDDDKLRELSLACGWSFVPSEGDARQIFESLQELDDDQNTSFNQPFSAASLWLERLAASRSGRVPSPEYTFTLTTDLDLDQQPVASSSRVRLPTPTPRSPAGPATVEDLLSEHEASFLQTSTIVETQTATDESHEDLPADVEEQDSA